MKKILTIVVLFFIAISCEEKVIDGNFDFNGELQVKHGEIVYSDNNHISLEILNVNDSRCPSDVVCVWEGEARIAIKFKNSTATTFELSTRGPVKDTIDHYIFELKEVDPYPISTEILKLEDYSIKLDITAL